MANRRPQVAPTAGRRESIDPLERAIRPPANESPEERERRLRAEEEARRISHTIDRMLREDDKERRRKKVVKILLLGQSESGKSTTLKQFQLLHTPAAFHAERLAWRFVIYLNLVRSIRRILEAIAPEPDTNGLDELDDIDSNETATIVIIGNGRFSSSIPGYENYCRRLAPLFELEQRLMRQLTDPEEPDELEATHLPSSSSSHQHRHPPKAEGYGSFTPMHRAPAVSMSDPTRSPPRITIPPGMSSSPTSPVATSPGAEPTVSTRKNWRKAFALGRNQSPKNAHSGELHGWWEDPHDPVHVLNRCAPTMSELWRDPRVRQRLAEKRIRLEESSGFYLDEIDRVTAKMYFPKDEDVLRARLKTNGVIEHVFSLPKNNEYRGVEWRIYDVGGAQSQRHAWAPYFEDVNAIIFLAPISAFDQTLAEDPTVNRLEDSLMLWTSVVSNKLLAQVNIILFLNKCDLLKRKLESGVRLSHHMISYKDRPNDYESIANYFRRKFGWVHHSYTPNKARECYVHFTSVTDTMRTHVIITNVRDIILTGNLKSSSLM
ncbi:G-alpha-domain-containing protein [Wolfiporia cocos MD-104 SS10]|uniref:G-alpha-domain-containing protein n=1 Tax=Wolfiporia cocos (strain MD-104) TaxID=742152 RepID=A0A2H3J330_WOLCO|nr:G-alpha-domain-containing protein [Wolfiporia cocos MD-104 SS10]